MEAGKFFFFLTPSLRAGTVSCRKAEERKKQSRFQEPRLLKKGGMRDAN